MTLRRHRLTVSTGIPPALVRPLDFLRRASRRRKAPSAETLVFTPVPELKLQERDAVGQLPFIRAMLADDRAAAGTNASAPSSAAELQTAIRKNSWYHTIALPHGVVTPGFYDHRQLVSRYGIPDNLVGKQVLDVATADGFWAFEFERRGATVTATDIAGVATLDLPTKLREAVVAEGLDGKTGAGFRVAHEALGSKVKRVETSIYDLGNSNLGTFDLVHAADILLHLENPLGALRAIRSVTGGTALIADCFDPLIEPGTSRYSGGWDSVTWWIPALETLGQMILDAGFSEVRLHTVYSLRNAQHQEGPSRAVFVATP